MPERPTVFQRRKKHERTALAVILMGSCFGSLACEKPQVAACDGTLITDDLSSPAVKARLAQTETQTMPVLACLVRFSQLDQQEKITCINSVRDKGMDKMKDDVHYTVQHTPSTDGGCLAITTIDGLLANALKVSQGTTQ
jgi:hypothetical protein